MASGRRRRVFRPTYRPVVTRVLPAVVVISWMAFPVAAATIGMPAAALLGGLGVPLLFLLLFLRGLVYREVRFGEEEVVVVRYLLPDVRGSYDRITDVGTVGFRLDGFVVAWHLMANRDELASVLERLVEEGTIPRHRLRGTLDQELAENRLAVMIGTLTGLGGGVATTVSGLAPAAVATDLFVMLCVLAGICLATPAARWVLVRRRPARDGDSPGPLSNSS